MQLAVAQVPKRPRSDGRTDGRSDWRGGRQQHDSHTHAATTRAAAAAAASSDPIRFPLAARGKIDNSIEERITDGRTDGG